VKKGLDRRGQTVLACVDSFNATVDQLSSLKRPSWIAAEAVPSLIEKKSIFSADPDSPVWSEITLGETYTKLWAGEAQASSAPAWVRNAKVRDGIKNVLLLDRIAEEKVRLNKEEANIHLWYVDVLQAAWNAIRKEGGKYHSSYPTCGSLLIY
jgi:hypothetical protein